MEESTAIKDKSCMYVCHTCEGGFICNGCIGVFDPCGSVFQDTLTNVKKTIKCPCCRQSNWNYHYNQIVKITLSNDLFEYCTDIPVIELYIKNSNL